MYRCDYAISSGSSPTTFTTLSSHVSDSAHICTPQLRTHLPTQPTPFQHHLPYLNASFARFTRLVRVTQAHSPTPPSPSSPARKGLSRPKSPSAEGQSPTEGHGVLHLKRIENSRAKWGMTSVGASDPVQNGASLGLRVEPRGAHGFIHRHSRHVT